MSLAPTELEQVYLEEFQEDEEVHHGVCPTCYPIDTGKQIALCGVDVTGEVFMPKAELTNICEACTKQEIPHQIKHLLGNV